MATPSGLPDDLQRPLDESVPAAPQPGEATDEPERTPLRRAVPTGDQPAPATDNPAGTRDTAPATGTVPEQGAAAEQAASTSPAHPTGTAPGQTGGAPPEQAAGARPEQATGTAPEQAADVAPVPATGWLTRAARAALAPGRAAIRGVRGVAAWAGRPSGRVVLPGTLVAGLLTAAVAAGAFVVPGSVAPVGADPSPGAMPSPGAAPPGTPVPTLPGVTEPPVGGGPGPEPQRPGNPVEELTGWAEQMAALTDVPLIALRAYGYAEAVTTQVNPGCQLRWTTLAGIGRVESGHGTSGETILLPDGRALPAIIGAPLDGRGARRLIADTDNGQLDGDPTYDRAVGPMQFIPDTWRSVVSPHNGIADIHNINDASLAAASYLCGNGRDLSTPADWWAAVLSYNNVQSYAEAVFAAANDYGLRTAP